jgi:hypothetical protein
LPADVRQVVVGEANALLPKSWGELPATLFLEFKRTGNRSHYEDVSFPRRTKLATLVCAEAIEDRGRFLDDIANGIWLICEETFWGVPASFPNKEGLPDPLDPTLELFAGETSALLAWTDYLLGTRLDKVSTQLRKRIRLETKQRILVPGLVHEDYGWMGLRSKNPVNNWNPWICSNWLITALLLDEDPAHRVASIHKIMRCLDRFLAGYHPDGGCDEGPGYWHRAGASLFECFEWLRLGSSGAIDFFKLPLVAEIGRYIYRAHIAGQWFVNFADAPARVRPSGDLIYRFGRAIGDRPMMAFGAWSRPKPLTARDSIGRVIPALFNSAELARAEASAPLLRDMWMPGLQVMAARERAGDTQGLYIAAQGGHNAESHNHNDVGNFIVYAGGEPALIDVGVERYTAKTFSAQRYDIWTMQSAYHNCPTVNRVMQAAGRQYAATDVNYVSTDAAAEFSLNLAKAYPVEAGLKSWTRRIRLDRTARRVEISDRYSLSKPAEEITLTLMTPLRPRASAGLVEIPGRLKVAFNAQALTAKVEEIGKLDASLEGVWGKAVYRILLIAANPPLEGGFTLTISQ